MSIVNSFITETANCQGCFGPVRKMQASGWLEEWRLTDGLDELDRFALWRIDPSRKRPSLSSVPDGFCILNGNEYNRSTNSKSKEGR
jgi:hypothetical protein